MGFWTIILPETHVMQCACSGSDNGLCHNVPVYIGIIDLVHYGRMEYGKVDCIF